MHCSKWLWEEFYIHPERQLAVTAYLLLFDFARQYTWWLIWKKLKAVSAHFTSKQILAFGFARQYWCIISVLAPVISQRVIATWNWSLQGHRALRSDPRAPFTDKTLIISRGTLQTQGCHYLLLMLLLHPGLQLYIAELPQLYFYLHLASGVPCSERGWKMHKLM